MKFLKFVVLLCVVLSALSRSHHRRSRADKTDRINRMIELNDLNCEEYIDFINADTINKHVPLARAPATCALDCPAFMRKEGDMKMLVAASKKQTNPAAHLVKALYNLNAFRNCRATRRFR